MSPPLVIFLMSARIISLTANQASQQIKEAIESLELDDDDDEVSMMA